MTSKLKLEITVDTKCLDEATEKANRLVELLQEAQQIADSLFQKKVKFVPKQGPAKRKYF